MKLEIDLSDRDEIAAAVPLLQLILDNTPSSCSGQCAHTPEATPDPAIIFGGDPAPLAPSAPALSTAGAAPSMTAPEAPPAISTPVPAPVPSAPTAPEAAAPLVPVAPATHAFGVELDRHGLPWDERIHASTKAKLQDGSWRRKKGIGDTYVLQVEAQLRALLNPPSTLQLRPFDATAEVPPTPIIPTAPPAAPSVPAAPVAPPESASPTTFDQLMPRLTAAITSGVMPPAALQAACNALGVASIVALQANQSYVPLIWAALREQFPALA